MGMLLSPNTHEVKARHVPPEAWVGRYLGSVRPERGSVRRTETVVFGLRTLLVVALVWLLVAGLLMLQLWPDLPESTLQWVLFIALGPPVYLLGESFFAWLLSRRHGQFISPHGFSFKRILVELAVLLSFIGFGGWLLSLLRHSVA